LLYCDEVTISEEDFILPHPGVFGRAFVLMPLAGIRPVLIPAEVDAAEVVEGMLVGGGCCDWTGQKSPTLVYSGRLS